MRLLVRIFSLSFSLCIMLAFSVAAAPAQMTYQGQITDPGGNPVPDGNYTITCRIYDVAGGGVALYTSGGIVTAAVDGIFTVQLLNVLGTFFTGDTRYMGIQVGADPEIFPRTRLTTVPYAYRVESVDSASGGTITGNLSLADATGIYAASNSSSNSLSTFNNSGIEVTRLWGASWGQLFLMDNSGDQVVELNANNSGGSTMTMRREDGTSGIEFDSDDTQDGTIRLKRDDGVTGAFINSGSPSVAAKGGEIELMDQFGLTVINLNASTTGNASVGLPDNAIWSPEMMNEPGIASSFDFTSPTVNGGALQTLDSVSITVPTAGYVVVTVSGYIACDHVSGTESVNRIYVSTGSASTDFDNFSVIRIPSAQTTDTYYDNFSIVYVDQINTGTQKYYLTADELSGAGQFDTRHRMVLQYYPTAYGTVVETAPPPSGSAVTHSVDGVGTWKSNVRTITLEEHQAAVAAEVAKLRAEMESTFEARLQKAERQQQQENDQK